MSNSVSRIMGSAIKALMLFGGMHASAALADASMAPACGGAAPQEEAGTIECPSIASSASSAVAAASTTEARSKNVFPLSEYYLTAWRQYFNNPENANFCETSGLGTWTTIVQPTFGTIRFGIYNTLAPAPCNNGRLHSFNAAYYTWTNRQPANVTDSFSVRWSGSCAGCDYTYNYTITMVPPKIVVNRPGYPGGSLV